MSDNTIEMNASDAIGAVQRGLQELLMYFSGTNAMLIDVPASTAHIDRLMPFLQKLHEMQVSAAQAHAAAGANGEARAN